MSIENELGKTPCPICDHPAASMRRSGKSGKPYVFCNDCGYQGFARGQKAVEKMLARLNVPTATQQQPEAPAKTEKEREWWQI